MKGRAVIIHNLEQARAALSAADRLQVPVTLLSAPNAAGYLGAAVFREMIVQAANDHPGVDFRAVLDCGEDPGLALGALRHGIKCLRIRTGGDVKSNIDDIAGQSGATIDQDDGETLDLLYQDDPMQACLDWLEKT
ncbi:MAG: class II fructose-bisphosphate aldolase [Rhodospirillales bacterium]